MERIGVPTVDTRDADGRHRFLGIGVDNERMSFRSKEPDFWFWKYSREAREGRECCSLRYVATHYALPDAMKYLDDAHNHGCEARGRDPY
jgi:glycoprotein-N-acetylgalactosamine 3-beta-galactosyltransferase